MDEKKDILLDNHLTTAPLLGFWSDGYKSMLIKQVEKMYKYDVLKIWFISDIVINGDKFLVKWDKRFKVLRRSERKIRC